MRRTLSLYTALYRSIFIPSTIVTAIIVTVSVMVNAHENIGSIAPNSFMKFFSTIVFLYFTNYRKRHEYFYYYNLHISKRALLVTALVVDLLVYAIAMVLTLSLLAQTATPL